MVVRRAALSLLCLAALAPLPACYSSRPAGMRRVVPNADVELRFTTPRDVAIAWSAGEPTLLNGVVDLEGRLIALTADTLGLVVERATVVEGGPPKIPKGGTALILRDAGVAVDVTRLDSRRTFLAAGGGMLALAMLAAGLVIFVTSEEGR